MQFKPAQFVYFDLGNVLLHFDHQIAVTNLSQLACIATHRAQSILFDSGLQDEYETGSISSQEFVDRLNIALGTKLPRDQVLSSVSSIFEPNHDILPCLQWVRQQAIPMGLLSNTCAAHWDWIVRQSYPMLDGWFGVHILSFEVGAMKPSPTIYRHAREAARVGADSILFIDDRAENVEGAKQMGWQAIQFVDAQQLMAILPTVLNLSD